MGIRFLLGINRHADGEAHAEYGRRGSRETPRAHSCLLPPSLHRFSGFAARGQILGDLERRPVLLWTAHSAAAAAVPGVYLAPPGGEWGAHRFLEHPPRAGEAQLRKTPHQNARPSLQPRLQAPLRRRGWVVALGVPGLGERQPPWPGHQCPLSARTGRCAPGRYCSAALWAAPALL